MRQLVGIGSVVVAALVLGAQLLPAGRAAANDDVLDLSSAGPATAKLKQVDLGQPEGNCQTKGAGTQSGDVQGAFDLASDTLGFGFALSGAAPDADYLVDVTECTAQGARIARGDGGHLHTDGAGHATFTGTWEPQSDAATVKLTLVRFCQGPKDVVPSIPCDTQGFATDALLPAGLERSKSHKRR